jgi:hypothetical protein
MLQRYLSAIASVAVLGVAGLWSTAGTTNARTVRVAGGDLQAALDAARAGDIILLDPGATYVGNFVLNAKEGRAYVTVQTAIEGARVTGPDGRVDTSQADLLAKIRTPNAAPALRTAPGAGYWRLQFLEIHGSGGGDLVRLGDGGAAQSRLDQVPEHFVIDRCYVHGDRRQGQKRGIALNSGRTMIVNSHFAHFGIPGQETQAIAGWNGPGPFVIENNYLEAAGVNLMFGGADPGIQGLVPANITIRRNHFAKRLEWRQDNRWVVKNLLELKSARHVTIEWNLLEYNWLHGQTGYAVVLKSWNQDGGAPWSIVEDVGIRYNVIRHVGSAFNILGRSYDHPAELTRRITIEHNLAYDVSARNWGGHGRFLLVGDGAAELSVNHNTVVQDGTFLHVYGSVGGQPQPVRGLRLTNNLGPSQRIRHQGRRPRCRERHHHGVFPRRGAPEQCSGRRVCGSLSGIQSFPPGRRVLCPVSRPACGRLPAEARQSLASRRGWGRATGCRRGSHPGVLERPAPGRAAGLRYPRGSGTSARASRVPVAGAELPLADGASPVGSRHRG